MHPFWLAIASVSAFIAVAAGAFGAHGLRSHLTQELLAIFETGVRYQFYHVVGLAIVAALACAGGNVSLVRVAGWCFLVGTVLFSGSLYALALSGIRGFGAVTPLGGVAFLAGWGCLAAHALLRR